MPPPRSPDAPILLHFAPTPRGRRGHRSVMPQGVDFPLIACKSAWGPDADRHAKLLIHLAMEGSTLNAYLQVANSRMTTVRLANLCVGYWVMVRKNGNLEMIFGLCRFRCGGLD